MNEETKDRQDRVFKLLEEYYKLCKGQSNLIDAQRSEIARLHKLTSCGKEVSGKTNVC